MKKILATLLFIGCLNIAMASGLTPYTATYNIKAFGLTLGKAERALTKNAQGLYKLSVHTRSTTIFLDMNIAQESLGFWKGFRPLHYRYHYQRKKEKTVDLIDFDWTKKKAASHYKDKVYTLPLTPNTQDQLSYQLNMRERLIAHPHTHEFVYAVADDKQIETYHFVVAGHEHLKTSLGELDTVKIVKKGDLSKRSSTFWLAPKYAYLLVKFVHVERGKKSTVYIDTLHTSQNKHTSSTHSDANISLASINVSDRPF